MELPCVLCCSKDDDEMVFGKVHKEEQLVVHCNCLYLSSNLVQNGNERTGILSFLKKDILMEMRRCRLLRCFYCQRLGANIGCCRSKCRRTFHTKCGYDNLAVSQFSGHYNSFCHQHIPKYHIRPGPAEQCVICFESLVAKGKRFSLATAMQSPCCRNGWYHRQCLQKYANSAGYFFKCPLCNDEEKFAEVALFGISIPNCDASWELEPNAFADQLQRSEYCTSPNCRIRPSANSAADLLYCILCGSNPMHTLCTLETASTYRCGDCIGITPSVASGSDESDSEVDVFDRLAELHRHRASTTSGGLNDTRDLRHSKLMASMRVSSESDDDDDEDDFVKAYNISILNQSRQPRAKPATETSSSSSVTPIARATRRTMPATRMLDENENEKKKAESDDDDDEDDFVKAYKIQNQSRQPRGKPATETPSSSSVTLIARATRRTMPATRMLGENENEREKAKKRRGSSRSPIGEPARRRSLQPISPRKTASRTNVIVAETRSRRTMPSSQPGYASNMDESCVANRTRTRLPSYMANKK